MYRMMSADWKCAVLAHVGRRQPFMAEGSYPDVTEQGPLPDHDVVLTLRDPLTVQNFWRIVVSVIADSRHIIVIDEYPMLTKQHR
jgi:hypothetical protein